LVGLPDVKVLGVIDRAARPAERISVVQPDAFSHVKVNGQPLESTNPTGSYLVDGSSHTEIANGGLTHGGSAFTMTWVASS
jgi:hypothetical protein